MPIIPKGTTNLNKTIIYHRDAAFICPKCKKAFAYSLAKKLITCPYCGAPLIEVSYKKGG